VFTWRIDTHAPDTTIAGAPDALSNRGAPTFTLRADEREVTFECSLDDGPFAPCEATATVTVTDGPHLLRARAVDAAGNVDTSPAQHTWRVDTVAPPTPVITFPADGGVVTTNTPTFRGTGVADTRVTLIVNGEVFGTAVVDNAGFWFFELPAGLFLPFGAHTVIAAARDEAGNVSVPTPPVRFRIEPDTDGDGLSDPHEGRIGTDPARRDSDDDRLNDFVETDGGAAGVDTDRDGVIDARDEDSDGDGTRDLDEGRLDSDRDGTPDWRDGDDDGDQIETRLEGAPFDLGPDEDAHGTRFGTDVDGDGVPNRRDRDSDGDGRRDRDEGRGDEDDDAIPNYLDRDDRDGPAGDGDGDGLRNGEERILGTNPVDPDSDADHVADGVEVTDVGSPRDTDRDGIIDALDDDDDGDGIASTAELDDDRTHGDVDGDATPARVDDESDGDGIADRIEGAGDADDDGVPNYLDPNADGDGRSDVDEGTGDDDADGAPNFLDRDDTDGPAADADGDGLTNGVETGLGTDAYDRDSDADGEDDGAEVEDAARPRDVDGDGAIDALDRDDDGDAIASADEDDDGRVHGGDRDEDGTPNRRDEESDGDGLDDAVEGRGDADGDGVPNYLDTDADGDGKADEVEGDEDADADGVPNFLDGDDADGPDGDPDGDALRNLDEVLVGTDPLDPDSDDDGARDGAEVGADVDLPRDTDGDRAIDARDPDDDGDGLASRDERDDGERHGTDVDDDGAPNERDTDADADEIGDAVEGRGDADGDEVPNYLDEDSDGDGTRDRDEGTGDADDDGVPNYLDPDDTDGPFADPDDDGVRNGDEVRLGTDPRDADSDDDGLKDGEEVGPDVTMPRNTDGDDLIDARDADDDGDGLETRVEIEDGDRFGGDADRDGAANWHDPNADDEGAPDGVEGRGDADGDGIPSYLDRLEVFDEDGDGVPDDTDNCPLAPNADQLDSDGDGAGDACDADADGDGFDDSLQVVGGGCAGCATARGGAAPGLDALWLVLGAAVLLWRRARRRVPWVVAFLLTSHAIHAYAQTTRSDFPIERLQPSIDRDGILDVEWGSVGRHLDVDAGAWVGYALNPLMLRNADERVGALVEHRVTVDVVGAVSLYAWARVGVDLPIVAWQRRGSLPEGLTARGLGSTGVGDLRVVPKLRVLRAEDQFVDLALVPEVTFPTAGPGDDYLGERGLVFAPAVVVSGALGPVRLAANLGYRVRKNARLLDLEVGDEFFYRFGAAYRFEGRFGLPLESGVSVTGATASGAPFTSVNQNPMELRLGSTFDLTRDVQVFGVLGAGVVAGFGTPDFRALFGVRWSPRFRDTDGDGVADADDRCEGESEDMDGHADGDGCVDTDNDGDGLGDDADTCPDAAEDGDGFQDTDGCPDPDNDGDGVPDVADACADRAEDRDGHADDDGCPETEDQDGDGVPDEVDRCADAAEDLDGHADEDGCPDRDNDGDGLLDLSDRCPDEAGSMETGGCPLRDRDHDDVLDDRDTCPDTAEDLDGFDDADGCPDEDNDGDGIADGNDGCPDEAEVVNGVNDADGCPD
jgi:hypothetical protein